MVKELYLNKTDIPKKGRKEKKQKTTVEYMNK